MKKYIIVLVLTAIHIELMAQTVNVHFKNGQTIEYPSVNVDYVDFSAKSSAPTVTPSKVVDLGLSVYWASCNIGASTPEEFGNYYAWGETKPKSVYYYETYAYYDSSTDTYANIGDDISGTEYDAATVNLGPDWRMPTKDEFQELLDNCTWEWTQVGNVNGYNVTAKNGNSIFIPASGQFIASSTSNGGNKIDLGLWSANVYLTEDKAVSLGDWGSKPGVQYSRTLKCYGLCVRPVTTNTNAGGGNTDHSNDNLVTDNISASFAGGAYTSMNGLITNGSQLSWRFSNNSTESVTLTGIQLINGATGVESNNLLPSETEVAAGISLAYTITVGALGIQQPKIRFTYHYNNKQYNVEASMPDSPF